MADPEITSTAPGVLALGGGGLAILLFALRRMISEVPAAQRDFAESELFKQLREQIAANAADIQEIRKVHAEEKREFEAKIKDLEQRIRGLTYKTRESQVMALRAFEFVSEHFDNASDHVAKLKTFLNSIIHNSSGETE